MELFTYNIYIHILSIGFAKKTSIVKHLLFSDRRLQKALQKET